jgi:hypothetical protein
MRKKTIIIFTGVLVLAIATLAELVRLEPSPTPTDAAVSIGLTNYYNATLTDSLNSPRSVHENNLAALPRGRQVFSGVTFEVAGVVQLSGKKLREWGRTEYPEAVSGIKVGKTCQRLYLLHGAGGVAYDQNEVIIAKLVLHYSDKSQKEIAIRRGEHVRDWWGDPKEGPTGTNSVLAWTGTNSAVKQYFGGKNYLRLYKTTFDNPVPAVAIDTIDYVSTMQNSSPFLIGLTIE